MDDLNAAALERMKSEGFQPAIVVETSPGNFQAWLNHGRVLARAESTAAARALAERFGGDRGAADWRHFGRLSGLTNRKPKYDIEWSIPVRPACGGQRPALRNQALIRWKELLRNSRVARKTRRPCRSFAETESRRNSKSIDSFRTNPVYGGDNTRADLAYAVYAFAHGASEDDVRSALHSRDFRHKGPEKRQIDYVNRTVKKA